MNAVAMRYAESLFDLAKEENAVEAYQKDMLKIHDIFEDPAIVQFFSHVALQDDIKVNVLNKSIEGQVSTYVYNFLLLLIKKRRIKHIVSICQCFQSLCNEYFGIKVGKIWSAYELSKDELIKVEEAMNKKLNKKVQLRMIIDESLIGGIKVEIDNHIYDDSLSYRLEALKQELLRK